MAGVLLSHIGLPGIVLIDVGTFLFAVGSLLLVRFPVRACAGTKESAAPSMWREMAEGLRFSAPFCISFVYALWQSKIPYALQ